MLLSFWKAPPLGPRFASRHRRTVFAALFGLGLLSAPDARADESERLTLEAALRLAEAQSLQLAAQRSAIAAAEQTTQSARQLPDPKAILGIDNLPITGADSFSLTQDFMTMRRIGILQEFPRAQKRELKGKLAERVTAREQATLVDTGAALRRDVAAAWVERYFAERMSEAMTGQIAEAQLQTDTLRAGLKAGKTQPAEFMAAQLNFQSLQDRQAEFDRQAERSKAMLSRWLGDAANRPLAEFVAPSPPSDQGVLPEHVSHHPHVQSLDRQVEVAQTEVDLAKAAAKPDWSLEVAYQQRGPSYSNMVSVQVSIDLPLFQARRQNRDIAAKLAQAEQARDLREDAVRLHLSEAQAAWAEWDAAVARLKRFDEALLPLAYQRTQATLGAYRGGRGDLASVLSARRDELDLKLQKLRLSADQARAYAQLLYFFPAGDRP